MFFDSLGQGTKDFIIILFIIFVIVLSVFIIILNSRVKWYHNQLHDNTGNCGVTQNELDNHKPMTTAVIISYIYLAVVLLIFMYSIYKSYTSGKLIGTK